MKIRINAVCGCGFRFGTDGISNESYPGQFDALEKAIERGVTGTALVIEAARQHSETTHHTLELHGEFRQEKGVAV